MRLADDHDDDQDYDHDGKTNLYTMSSRMIWKEMKSKKEKTEKTENSSLLFVCRFPAVHSSNRTVFPYKLD